MTVLVAITIGVLFACGTFLLLRRSVLRLIIGLALLSHGTNLFLFTMGWMRQGRAPLVGLTSVENHVDPIPQALILTAIVIGFATQAFVLVLAYRAHEETGTDDLEQMKTTDAA